MYGHVNWQRSQVEMTIMICTILICHFDDQFYPINGIGDQRVTSFLPVEHPIATISLRLEQWTHLKL